MVASFPAGIKSFGAAHQDFTENILAAHVNDVQDEIVALENNLGTNPHVGVNLAGTNTTYANLKARIDAVMDGVRTHTHSGTSGVKLDQGNTHQNVDTDLATTSLHHTLGTSANQAAQGNHAHTGIPSSSVTGLDTHISSTAAHGATGAVVGTTNSQTIQNKTLDGTNTFPSTFVTLTGAQALTNKDLTGAGNTFPTSLATLTGVQTLTNKTISGANNTLSAIPSSAVTGLDAHTGATSAHGVTGNIVGTGGAQTLTNKTITSPTINGGGSIFTSSAGGMGLNAGGTAEIILGYGGGGGLSIAQGAGPVTHTNGVVLWVSGNSLYFRHSNGADAGPY